MKLHRLDQNIKCPECKTTYSVKECKRVMNFTLGEILFYCKNCRAKLGFTDFAKWNKINREDLEKQTSNTQSERSGRERPPRRQRGRR